MIPYLLSFSLPMGNIEYPYGMPPTVMAGVQTSASTYVDNTMAITSPYNPRLASGLAISNPSRTMPPPGGLSYIP